MGFKVLPEIEVIDGKQIFKPGTASKAKNELLELNRLLSEKFPQKNKNLIDFNLSFTSNVLSTYGRFYGDCKLLEVKTKIFEFGNLFSTSPEITSLEELLTKYNEVNWSASKNILSRLKRKLLKDEAWSKKETEWFAAWVTLAESDFARNQ